MKVVMYTRVGKQHQLEKCTKYANLHNLEVVMKTTEEKHLFEKNENIDAVLMPTASVLSRDPIENAFLSMKIVESGKSLIYAMKNMNPIEQANDTRIYSKIIEEMKKHEYETRNGAN